MNKTLNLIIRVMLRGYTRFLSPHKGHGCAHRIVLGGHSCSSYYEQALDDHRVLDATRLLCQRLRACSEVARNTKGDDGRVIVPCIPFI